MRIAAATDYECAMEYVQIVQKHRFGRMADVSGGESADADNLDEDELSKVFFCGVLNLLRTWECRPSGSGS